MTEQNDCQRRRHALSLTSAFAQEYRIPQRSGAETCVEA